MISSLILGKNIGFITAFVADLVFGFTNPFGYLPLYTLSSLSWGFFAGFINQKKYNIYKMSLAVVVSYVFATLSNSFANYMYYGKILALSTLYLRLITLVISTPILIFLTNYIYKSVNSYVRLYNKNMKQKDLNYES